MAEKGPVGSHGILSMISLETTTRKSRWFLPPSFENATSRLLHKQLMPSLSLSWVYYFLTLSSGHYSGMSH